MLVLAWGGGWLFHALLTQYYFVFYPFVPLFFFIIGVLTISIFVSVDKTNPGKLVNVYMLIKMIKMLLSAIFALVYIIGIKDNNLSFGVVFAIYYLIYLGLETYFYSRMEKAIKRGLL